MQTNKTTLAVLAALSLSALAAHAASSIVYSNATTYTGRELNPGLSEVGDEIILAPGPRFGVSFRFEYYGSNFSGNETVQLRFRRNDGAFAPGSTTFRVPNSILYDSAVQTLPTPIDPSRRNTLLFDISTANSLLPERFTWTAQFTGIGAGETAGLSIYNPPTVGMSENDYWFNNAGAWELRGTNVAINFGAALIASTVPEPSTYMLAIVGGLCGLTLVSRRARKN